MTQIAAFQHSNCSQATHRELQGSDENANARILLAGALAPYLNDTLLAKSVEPILSKLQSNRLSADDRLSSLQALGTLRWAQHTCDHRHVILHAQ